MIALADHHSLITVGLVGNCSNCPTDGHCSGDLSYCSEPDPKDFLFLAVALICETPLAQTTNIWPHMVVQMDPG
jgi:hypothetical protein